MEITAPGFVGSKTNQQRLPSYKQLLMRSEMAITLLLFAQSHKIDNKKRRRINKKCKIRQATNLSRDGS